MIQSWLLVLLVGASPVEAAKVAVKVSLPAEVALKDDELFVVWSDACTAKAAAKKLTLRQEGNAYKPRALVAQLGQALVIHNGDQIQHNSFALKAIKFDSGLQKPESNSDVKLDKSGVTKVFCRIHPTMTADVLVLNNKCFVELNAADLKAGKGAELEAGGGKGKFWLWSPALKTFHSRALADGASFSLAKDHFSPTVKRGSPSGGAAY